MNWINFFFFVIVLNTLTGTVAYLLCKLLALAAKKCNAIRILSLIHILKSRGAKSVRLCTLMSKPSRRVVDVPVDYIGYEIPDEFVVGYGLDYAQRYRNLPYVGVVEFE